jgi:hypothetical protein
MDLEKAGKDQKTPLVEHVTQPGVGHIQVPAQNSISQSISDENPLSEEGAKARASVIIWTPRFILIFGLTLVLGLSLESILTQGWLNIYYTGQWIFLAHVVLIGLCWLTLAIVARSSWIRTGALFGLIWTMFMLTNILIQVILVNPTQQVLAHVNVVTCLALLGCYICLSIDRVPVSRWDAWFLGMAPLIGIATVALEYFLLGDRSLFGLENNIATVALVLCLLVWGIRPSCWMAAPALTLLFGSVPVILLILNAANVGYNAFNFFLSRVVLDMHLNLLTREPDFFYSQVALLCLLLGAMRLMKCELAN